MVLAWQAVAGLGPAVVKFPRLDFPRSTRSNHTQAIFPLPSHPDQEARLSQTCAALPKQTYMYTIISQHDWSVEEAGGSFPQKIPASCKRFWLTWSLTYYFLRACLSCNCFGNYTALFYCLQVRSFIPKIITHRCHYYNPSHSLTYHLCYDIISLSRNFDHNIIISIFVTGCTGGLCHPTSGWRRRVPMENRGEQINTTTAIYDTSIIITTTVATT